MNQSFIKQGDPLLTCGLPGHARASPSRSGRSGQYQGADRRLHGGRPLCGRGGWATRLAAVKRSGATTGAVFGGLSCRPRPRPRRDPTRRPATQRAVDRTPEHPAQFRRVHSRGDRRLLGQISRDAERLFSNPKVPKIAVVHHQQRMGIDITAALQAEMTVGNSRPTLPQVLWESGYRFTAADRESHLPKEIPPPRAG